MHIPHTHTHTHTHTRRSRDEWPLETALKEETRDARGDARSDCLHSRPQTANLIKEVNAGDYYSEECLPLNHTQAGGSVLSPH